MSFSFGRPGSSGGSGGGSFTPSQNNLYSAVKNIFHPATNDGVTADDANRELDVAAGSSAPSVSPNIGALVRQAGATDRGLFLSAEGADLSWHLRGAPRDEAEPAQGGHVDLLLNPGPGVTRVGHLRLEFPASLPAEATGGSDYSGANSNNLIVQLLRIDSVTSSPSISWASSTGTILITLGRTTTAAQVRTAFESFNSWDTTNPTVERRVVTSITGSGIGSDTLVLAANNFASATHQVAGGRDEIPSGVIEVIAQPDAENPNILVKYDADGDTLQDLLDDLESNDEGVTITVVFGTDLTASPEATPFERSFFRGAGAGGSSFTPSQDNLYDAVKTIFHPATNGGVTADDDNLELDVSADYATRAQAHLGVLELSVNSDQAVFDTLVNNIAAGLVNTGDKWYISNPGATTYFGKIVRYNGVAINRGAGDHGFAKYFDLITTSSVDTDATIDGDGINTPLIVANPFTDADENKLDGINAGAEVNVQTNWLETDTSDDSFLLNKPTDAQLGDAAFSNPPSDLSDSEKAAVQTAIGALIGGRTETISFDNETTALQQSDAEREITPASTDPIAVVVGSGDARILSSVSGNDFTLAAGLHLIEVDCDVVGGGSNAAIQFHVRQASDNGVIKATGGIFVSSGNTIHVAEAMVLWLSSAMSINIAYGALRQPINSVSDISISFTQLSGGANEDSGETVHPQITSFTLRTGDLTPVAGSIAGVTYGVDWAIANSDHIGAARIIGFKGAFGDGTGAVLLNNIPQGSYAHGQGNVVIPNGVSLADNETYTMRLQVYETGIANPELTDAPRAYQDLIIRAHAAATANYHWGRLAYAAGRTAAQYAALIDFSTDDLVTGATLNTTDGYEATPDTTGTWVFYLAAKADQTQPSSWLDHNGLPASSAFEAVVTQSIDSVSYSVYIMSIQRTNADGSQTYIPRT